MRILILVSLTCFSRLLFSQETLSDTIIFFEDIELKKPTSLNDTVVYGRYNDSTELNFYIDGSDYKKLIALQYNLLSGRLIKQQSYELHKAICDTTNVINPGNGKVKIMLLYTQSCVRDGWTYYYDLQGAVYRREKYVQGVLK